MKGLLLILLCFPMIGFGQVINFSANDYYNRAMNNQSDWKYQIDNYTEAIRIDPDFAAAYNNRGIVFYTIGNYKDAIDDYSRAIRIDPDDALVYYNRGIVYYSLGNYKNAIDDYSRAIRIDPDNTSAYVRRGVSYLELGNNKDAIDDFTRTIKLDSEYFSAYYNRGIMKENAGLPYCSDYKRACDLGFDKGCEWYYKLCK